MALLVGAGSASHAAAVEHGAPAAAPAATVAPAASKPVVKMVTEVASAPHASDVATDLKKALKDKQIENKSVTLVIKDKPEAKPALHAAPAHAAAHAPAAAHAATNHAPAATNPRASRDYIKAKAAAMTGHQALAGSGSTHGDEVHWAYEGVNGPQNWGNLKPEFNACAIGRRQSPINIEDPDTLRGPAEALQFNYTPSSGTVVNNGHTIQVDLQGDNSLTVRGLVYKLVQFHFHTPSEEQVNYRHSAMVTHLVHKSTDGQLAVVAVLLDPGVANSLINKVWTYMPLDTNDRVRLPVDIINVNELLPKDQRYYQFMGSLTTPPCTENVLWMVLKQTTQVSKDQIRLFQQLYPANARPVQPVNDRPVRNAQ